MSYQILSACWRITNITPTQKLVLISLADQANDNGVCWPSVFHIQERTCLSERAVRNAIKELSEIGIIEKSERNGRSTYYTITPAPAAPLQEMHPTPAGNAPLPLHEVHPTPAPAAPITIIEPSLEPSVNHIGETVKIFDDDVIGEMPLSNGNDYLITESLVTQYESLYPDLDVIEEMRKMKAWLISNQPKRKSSKGMPRFINSWLSRADEKRRQA